MDYLAETIALGIDSIILVACIRQYYKNKNSMNMIMSAPYLTIDKKLEQILKTLPEEKLPYCSLRASVKPLGNPIISNNNPHVHGVIQSLKIKEHVVQRSSAGFWADSERTIQHVHNVMPFGLENKGVLVEITDPLAAEYLDMEVISDTFHPTVPTMMDHIWGFFAGVRQRGVQSTEKMLRQGTIITGIGELIYSKEDGTLKLQPPTTGTYYLTTMTVASLLKKIEKSVKNFRLLCLLFGTVGILLAGILIRRFFKYKKQLKKEEERKVKLEETRKKRRRMIRDTEVQENQICVVCKSNPIEMILLPCGHVCLCEDCAEDITEHCPICRSTIETRSVAYLL
ncbi:mitochondrial E3 ubiquitin protein ligase 1 [Cylas formicarius]|uniref:mitochondrial E3 ubiquitin protein ligase 1 n=1 Tax=Cylas formicarius TaxID=197179 RepID=UPI002958CF09|nr:mitochondrial E3 ubiquitin protein ligase 1 [Cylas formicarius]